MAGSMTWVRERAFLSMTSPLGPDALIPVRLRAEEAISTPYRIRIEAVSDHTVTPDGLLNHPACITLQAPSAPARYFHGIVRSLRETGAAVRRFRGYELELVPRFWFLSQTEDCRVFQDMSAIDILRRLLADAGVEQSEFRLYGEPHKRDYTVQYNETDLAFVTRLLTEEGCFYFFEHGASGHTLVVANGNAAFRPLEQPSLYLAAAGDHAFDALTGWRPAHRTATGRMELSDYDPAAPTTLLDARQNTTLATGGSSQRDVFHWPAHTLEPGFVMARTRNALEAEEVAAGLIEGAGNHHAFLPGRRFSLASGAGEDFVVHGVTHEAHDETWLGGAGGTGYGNSFTAFSANRPWRPQRSVRRPAMAGIFSAEVIGPEGEEIFTDKLGRVKVRLRFDHRRETSADQAIWVRVMQPWAGPGWGFQFLPRVGTEVAVAFMDGDADRPVVLGGLYNAAFLPPFALPSEKTKSGLRTRSSLNGGASDYSELSFDDTTGSEKVLLHAQKDCAIEIEHDHVLTVGHCRTKKVTLDETMQVGRDRTAKVTGNDALKVETGNLSVEVETGRISEQAFQSIELKVGGNSIRIDQAGITISGLMVRISGEVMLDMKAPMSALQGEGLLTLKGGLVMVN